MILSYCKVGVDYGFYRVHCDESNMLVTLDMQGDRVLNFERATREDVQNRFCGDGWECFDVVDCGEYIFAMCGSMEFAKIDKSVFELA